MKAAVAVLLLNNVLLQAYCREKHKLVYTAVIVCYMSGEDRGSGLRCRILAWVNVLSYMVTEMPMFV
jgi:hypothetical protein